jgi:amino acid permease
MWTAAAHVITAVIGSGVLSLAWSMAQLGWVAGPVMMLVFAAVTALQSTLFADCYRSPDPEHGPHRNRTYAGAVDRNLGTPLRPLFILFCLIGESEFQKYLRHK